MEMFTAEDNRNALVNTFVVMKKHGRYDAVLVRQLVDTDDWSLFSSQVALQLLVCGAKNGVMVIYLIYINIYSINIFIYLKTAQ